MEQYSQPKEGTLVALIRSEKWKVLTFFAITIPMLIHTQHLMMKVSGFHFDLFPYDEELYALFFAVGFDLAMITFAVNGREKEASALAWIVFIFNAFFLNYDYLMAIGEIPPPYAPIIVKVIINLTIAGTASWIVHSYVQIYVEGIKEQKLSTQFIEKAYGLEKQISAKDKEILAIKSELDIALSNIETLKKEKELQDSAQREDFTTRSSNAGPFLPVHQNAPNAGEVKTETNTSELTCLCGKVSKNKSGFSSHIKFCAIYLHHNPKTDNLSIQQAG
jgi:hypothetical protein